MIITDNGSTFVDVTEGPVFDAAREAASLAGLNGCTVELGTMLNGVKFYRISWMLVRAGGVVISWKRTRLSEELGEDAPISGGPAASVLLGMAQQAKVESLRDVEARRKAALEPDPPPRAAEALASSVARAFAAQEDARSELSRSCRCGECGGIIAEERAREEKIAHLRSLRGVRNADALAESRELWRKLDKLIGLHPIAVALRENAEAIDIACRVMTAARDTIRAWREQRILTESLVRLAELIDRFDGEPVR